MWFSLSLVSFGCRRPGADASGVVLGTSVSSGTQELLCRGLNDGSTLDGRQKLGAGSDAWRRSSQGDAAHNSRSAPDPRAPNAAQNVGG
jgi:hypothetical protein